MKHFGLFLVLSYLVAVEPEDVYGIIKSLRNSNGCDFHGLSSKSCSSFVTSNLAFAQAYVEGAQPNATCVEPGLMCRNCDELAVCISTIRGKLKQWTVGRCPGGSCRDGVCVPGAKCNYRDFRCSEDGSFPDPYDCTKFHVCTGGDPIPQTQKCPGIGPDPLNRGTAYNSTLNYCGFPIEDNPDCVTGPVPRCQRNLQIEPLSTNRNIYVICTEDSTSLGPNLFKCPPATEFNASTFECN